MLHFHPASDDHAGVHLIGISPYIDCGEAGLNAASRGLEAVHARGGLDSVDERCLGLDR